MKKRNWIAVIMAVMLLASCFYPVSSTKASVAEEEKFVAIADKKDLIITLVPGETTHVKLPVKAIKEAVMEPYFYGQTSDETPFTIGEVTMTTETGSSEVTLISSAVVTYLEFDITTKEDAKIKTYDYSLIGKFNAYVLGGEYDFYTYEPREQELNLKARVLTEKSPAQVVVDHVVYDEDQAVLGNKFDLTFDVINEGELAALNVYAEIDYTGTDLVPAYTVENRKVGDLKAGQKKSITIPVKVLATAAEGSKTVAVNFTYKDTDGQSVQTIKKVYIQVKKDSTQATGAAKLSVASDSVNYKVLSGNDCTLSGTVKNIGEETASDITVSVIDGIGAATGILLKTEGGSISLRSLEAGGRKGFSLPLLVTEGAQEGLNEITVQVDYTDAVGEARTAVSKMYVTVVKPAQEETVSDVVITNAVQSPASPAAGEKVKVSFVIENRGDKAVTEVKVGGLELSSAGFEPYTSQAQKEIGTLKAKEKKQVTLEFKVGAEIPEGLNTLSLGCEYKDSTGTQKEQTTKLYILNVVNDSNSKPKIIVSDFSVDSEELKAGSTFLFTFDLKNTHTSKAAKNIKVTISQADNVFSAAQGTNSFYIDRIGPSETVQNSLEMRVKADVTTGAYELLIQVEYEYDDMSQVDIEAGGVTEENKLKLQAVENLRPSIQNLVVGQYGEMPYVNQSSTLSFDFINMGKSPLSNVSFKLEGDFMLETGDSYFQGTVNAGENTYVELMVIPQMEGQCSGVVDIIFENSNGDEVTIPYEFSNISVMGEQVFDDPSMGGEMSDPAYQEMPVSEAKKNILPVWLFVIIEAAVLLISMFVVRAIVISRFKKKQQKQDEDL